MVEFDPVSSFLALCCMRKRELISKKNFSINHELNLMKTGSIVLPKYTH